MVTGTVDWDRTAARREPDLMTEGDLRLVAVSEDGHHPTVLAATSYEHLDADASRSFALAIKGSDKDAIRPGNRVVLTASQHGAVPVGGAKTERTYVTVDQLQPFGAKQDRIGRRDCGAVAITPGANLNECDLTGADLDNAVVSQRSPEGLISRMLLADLTGATMRGADLTGLSVAGGRLNGADLAKANLTNLSLAKAEATGLDASGAVSDPKEGTGGGNFFDTDLAGSNFQGVVFNGVSLNHADLDRADLSGAHWTSVHADTASFRGADLRDLAGNGNTVTWADLTDAKLKGSSLTPVDLTWAYLCHTQMPDDSSAGLADRDCRGEEEKRPEPATDPAVVVKGDLDRGAGKVTVKARVEWNGGANLSVGDLRLVAVDGRTDVPTQIAEATITDLPATSPYEVTVTDPKLLAAMKAGNRVVLTATQHPPLPDRRTVRTNGSYVAVDTLQVGPGRGRVGSRDCSGTRLVAKPPAGVDYDFCDLVGAVLTQAQLGGNAREADLTGAEMTDADLGGLVLDGSALGGATLSGGDLGGISLIAATAPQLTARRTRLDAGQLRAADLDGADFEFSVIGDTTFAVSDLHGAHFTEASFRHVDLGLTDLTGARLDGVDANSPDEPNSLFLADLTDADLSGSTWSDDESGSRPWLWATLCHTAMPPGAQENGDRDCLR